MRGRDLEVVAAWRDAASVAGPAWMAEPRRMAWAALATLGFPGPGDEAWRFTPGRSLSSPALPVAGGGALPAAARWWSAIDADRIVFVNGQVDRAASTVDLAWGARSSAPADGAFGAVVDAAAGGFDALNLATASDGVWTVRASGSRPLLLVHRTAADGVLVPVRHRIVVPPGASAEVYAVWEGAGTALVSGVTEVEVGDGAQLRWTELQDEPVGVRHVHTWGARVGRDATVTGIFVQIGARVARTDVRASLGAGSTLRLHGLTLGRDEQHLDVHTTVHHDGPHATSRQHFKTILDGVARGVFTGRVVVPPGAVGTDASQSAPALLLSPRAVANARPQLEIRCDDLKATHGAAIGAVDPEAAFFLQARGLDALQARALLTLAFAREVVSVLPEALQGEVEGRVADWLGAEVG
jgi:Fe-S cluster assembly protein SufD